MSPVLWLTPASDTTVNDTRVHGGYHHLALLKVRHQLTVAGIDGATFLGDPEVRNLAWGPTSMVEGDGRWRRPRYLSRRGGFHVRRYLCPWPPTIPVTPFHDGRSSRSCQFSPYPDMHSDDHAHLVVDDGLLNRGFHKPVCLSSHPGRSEGVLPFLPTCLHSIPTSANEIRHGNNPEDEGRFGARWSSCGPDWSSGDLGDSPTCLFQAGLVLNVLDVLHWRDVSQLLQQSEVTQRR